MVVVQSACSFSRTGKMETMKHVTRMRAPPHARRDFLELRRQSSSEDEVEDEDEDEDESESEPEDGQSSHTLQRAEPSQSQHSVHAFPMQHTSQHSNLRHGHTSSTLDLGLDAVASAS